MASPIFGMRKNAAPDCWKSSGGRQDGKEEIVWELYTKIAMIE